MKKISVIFILFILFIIGCSNKDTCIPDNSRKDLESISCEVKTVIWKVENTCKYHSKAQPCQDRR